MKFLITIEKFENGELIELERFFKSYFRVTSNGEGRGFDTLDELYLLGRDCDKITVMYTVHGENITEVY